MTGTSSEQVFRRIRLAIVNPMANESETAVRFVREVQAQCAAFSFLNVMHYTIFDRACTDGTADLLRELRLSGLQVVDACKSRCVVDAYMRGYKQALDDGADWILEIDAGFSHAPKDIPKLLHAMSEGYDCVFGSRFCKGGQMLDAPLGRRVTSYGGTLLSNLLLGTRLTDMTSGFELFTRKALEAILARGIVSRGPFFQTEIKAFAHRFNICEVPITYTSPSHIVSQAALMDAFGALWRLFKLRLNQQL